MSEPITIIGANTVVNGNLEGDEDLTIEGRVEGTINLSRTLTIDTNGVVHANINVRNAVISGVLVGNIQAEDSVHITEEGRVIGDIAAPRVILVEGASFRGSIDMGEFDVDRAETKAPSSKTAPKIPARQGLPAPRETEDEAEKSEKRPVARAIPAPVMSQTAVAATVAKAKPPVVIEQKKAPKPKVRSVGKTKAVRKKSS